MPEPRRPKPPPKPKPRPAAAPKALTRSTVQAYFAEGDRAAYDRLSAPLGPAGLAAPTPQARKTVTAALAYLGQQALAEDAFRIEDPRWVDLALQVLPDAKLMADALRVLAAARDPRAIEPLVALAATRFRWSMVNIPWALHRIGGPRAAEALADLMALHQGKYFGDAYDYLEQLGALSVGPLRAFAARPDADPELARPAAELAERLSRR